MASLGDVVGALVSEIGRGRSQGDVAAAEIAQIYKDHPVLSSFPIPRMTLDEVVVDLRLAIAETAATPSIPGAIDDETRSEILARLNEIASQLPATDPILKTYDALQATPFKDTWAAATVKIAEQLAALLPPGGTISTTSVAVAAAALIQGHLCSCLLAPESGVPPATAQEILSQHAPGIEQRLRETILTAVADIIAAHYPQVAPEHLEVLVTAAELQAIPPERLTTLKLTLRETDQSWVEVDLGQGQKRWKLVPA